MAEEKVYNLTKKELNSEKVQVLAKFASIASHDLKNVIGGLSNIAYYLSKAMKIENDTQKKMLTMLSTEVNTLNQRISEILDKTRVKQLTKVECDINELISKAIEESKIDGITINFQSLPAKVFADKDRLKQVFFNIIKNAKDALKNNGTINIVMNQENNHIVTTISDCGEGMSQETLEKCFDPMFSTRLARSVGMGLTVALQIVEMHNGTIKISSQQQKGTDVVVSIPMIVK